MRNDRGRSATVAMLEFENPKTKHGTKEKSITVGAMGTDRRVESTATKRGEAARSDK